jgi:hypothetical protein
MNNDSVWFDLIKYINKRKIDSIITRKDIHNELGYSSFGVSTIDMYRRTLLLIGFLEEGLYRGEYIKKSDIPLDLTSTKAKELVYSENKNDIKNYIRSLKIKKII